MRLARVIPAGVVCACAVLSAGSHRTTWELSDYTWVKLVSVEKGAGAVEHPVDLDGAALRRGLAAIQFGGDSLFEAKELDTLVKPLVEALAGARPDEEVVLLSTNRRGAGFLSTPYGLTARMFVEGGRVNLIVHDARLDFVGRVRANDMVPRFSYGSRTVAGEVVLDAKGLVAGRSDWVAFPAVVAKTAPVAAPVALAPEPPVAAPPAPPVPAVVQTPAPAPAVVAPDQAMRLRTLKRLREENLISEEEYQKKRKEILATL